MLLEAAPAAATVADAHGWTAMHLTAYQGHAAVVGLLLEPPAAATIADAEGWLPLHGAAEAGNAAASQPLLQAAGAAAGAVDCVQWTPLHQA